MKREGISSPNAPAAIGPYRQAVLTGDTLYCSGQIPLDPSTGKLVTGSIEVQTEQIIENLGAVLQAAGMDFKDVVHCRVYLTDMADYAHVNEVYARYFSEFPPAREAVQVSGLPRNARLEISCIAVKK